MADYSEVLEERIREAGKSIIRWIIRSLVCFAIIIITLLIILAIPTNRAMPIVCVAFISGAFWRNLDGFLLRQLERKGTGNEQN